MLKLLRNLVLAAILVAGALKLLAWYAVGHDAERVTAALAPYAQLKYDGLAAGLDGSVTLSNVTLASPGARHTLRAESLTLQTPNLFWLLKHSLFHGNELPPRLGMAAQGLHLPPLADIDPQFVDPANFVPFAAVGCGAAFTPADYHRMTAPTAASSGTAEYHLQPDNKTLDWSATVRTPGYSTLALHGDLHPFDLAALASTAMWDKLHAGQLAVDVTDDGFIAHRNAFCAQRLGLSVTDFAARHLAAVQALLTEHRVEASAEVLQLYRNFVEHGGGMSLLSLPRTTFVLSDWRSNAPDDLLRQLNITARYRDKPPVMFRLTFLAPSTTDDTSSVATTAQPPTTVTTSAPPVVATAPTPAPPTAVVATPSATQAMVAAATPAVVTAPADSPLAKKTLDNFGLHDLDRVEAKLANKTAPAKPAPTPVATPEPAKPEITETSMASGPAPPANSTLALVWKPTIERLPPAAPKKTDYDVIDYGNLTALQGRRVRLITDGNKRIEGYVIAADGGAVRLRVGRNDGDAQFEVPKKRIQQVQLLHPPSG